MAEIKTVPAFYFKAKEFKTITPFDKMLFDKVEELITKVNEIVKVINSLEHDDSLMSSIQHRGGSDA